MGKDELYFPDFLLTVEPENIPFVQEINEELCNRGLELKLTIAQSGNYVASYVYPANKKVVLNFIFRRKKLHARIYGDYVNHYMPFLETLPETMVKKVDKAPLCKRLLNPQACNSRCPMGYAFTIKGAEYKKCRYNSFLFEVTPETGPVIKEFVQKEIGERAAAS